MNTEVNHLDQHHTYYELLIENKKIATIKAGNCLEAFDSRPKIELHSGFVSGVAQGKIIFGDNEFYNFSVFPSDSSNLDEETRLFFPRVLLRKIHP